MKKNYNFMKLSKLILLKAILLSGLIFSGCAKHEHHHKFAKNSPVPNEFWWPKKINLNPLRFNSEKSNPLPKNFDYAKEFAKLDLNKVKKDINKVLTTSQDWWPADYGNYGPFFIRMAWHSAGTYRTVDGRGGASGGQLRFEPLNSWPDNANLDKARRLLWPIKKKYGNKISWSDLMILTGNVALENMGFKTIGFAGGRVDDWEADLVYWGPENKFLASKRHDKKGNLRNPLGATNMGLIYVNPEGPNGNPDPLLAAKDIRETFGRMAMDDEETVALIAGGHTFGKVHGAHRADKCLGKEPAGAKIEEQGFGWKNKCGNGNAQDTVTSGLEGAWTSNPIAFTTQYLDNLFIFDWVKTKSPGGAIQWVPKDKNAQNLVPDAHLAGKKHPPIMLTTDLSLKFDPQYRVIAKRFQENPEQFAKAFARAWFKLTHRDMGASSRYIGKDIPKESFVWQDPLPKANYKPINSNDIIKLKQVIAKSNLTNQQLIKTAWASSASFRNTDNRGGSNGARIKLEPQASWQVNEPVELAKVLSVLEKIQNDFNKTLSDNKKVSLADVIVLSGNLAVERSAQKAGFKISIPFKVGRTDALQSQTDVNSFTVLEPKADGFRNYFTKESLHNPVNAMIDKASMLNLTIPEMTVLVGGLRVLDVNYANSKQGILTNNIGKLDNSFFVNLLDMSTVWKKSANDESVYEGFDRSTNQLKWQASAVDLMFGSSSELRAVAEYYASDDNKKIFIDDFVKAWNKVMNN
ncbi:catalase-peroxidase [Alphaproteobacteria bacterium]|nr:catalase-peroxidase [Alphaproteobacteria bacterium]